LPDSTVNPSDWNQVSEAAASVASRAGPLGEPLIGLVLGSGLRAFADRLTGVTAIACADIPHLPTPTVSGHGARLLFGQLGSAKIACLEGRVHLYQGYSAERVVFGVRLLTELGCKAVLLTNAAGAIARRLHPGAFMLIVDHINLTGHNPLVASSPTFIDMSLAYDSTLCKLAERAARDCGVELERGVYAAVLGPSYETPAEIRGLGALGADAVGMSTALEVIALRAREVKVAALSSITNYAAGLSSEPLTHGEVERTAAQTAQRFGSLLERWIELVSGELSA
jgi:purine-nucleoside phosphorylase